MADLPSYPRVPRSTVVRYRPRGKYDYKTIHSIVNSVPVVHVSFPTPDPEDPFPAVLPMIGFVGLYENEEASHEEEPLDIYLHGYVSSRLMKLGGTSPVEEHEGFPVTIAATHLDGLVLALTPNNHSYNYRSAILHGYATAVTSTEEKLWAMKRITDGVVTDRWDNSRVPPTKTEMTSTQILKVRVVSASAKVRAGTTHDDKIDLKNDEVRERTWIGVVPTYVKYGEPIASPENKVKNIPSYLEDFIKEHNESNEQFAKENAVE